MVPGAGGGRKNGLLGGRPPDEFKRRMRELASSDKALAFLEECANGEHGPQFAIKAQEYAAERGYGKEAQDVNVKGKVLVVRDVGELEASE